MKNLSAQTKFNLIFLVLLLAILVYQIVLDQKIERARRIAGEASSYAWDAVQNTQQIKDRLNINE